MNTNFQISKNSVQGLGSQLLNGNCSIEQDLALVKTSGRWTLIDTRKENIPLGGMIIKGKDLIELMQFTANEEKNLPDKFLQIKDLTQDPRFRRFCRLIPGIESHENAQSREKSAQAMQRAFEAAKVIGKGLSQIEKQGLEGRYVGQDQGKHPYWMREVIFAGDGKSTSETDILIHGWELDKDSRLSLKEWESAKKEEWKNLNPGKDFLPWIADQAWDAEEKETWEKAHPGEVYDKGKFLNWPEAQTDPDLFLPVWLLKKISGKTDNADFQAWRVVIKNERQEEWTRFKEETGANLTFEEHETLDFEYGHSGSVDSIKRWMLQQLWQKASTSDDFPTFVQKLKWTQEKQTGKTQESFDNWVANQERILHERHQGTHLPLSFEEWRAQQDDSILLGAAPFINLNAEQRKIYCTNCENGILKRNGYLFDTAYEKTLHSGNGYAILVIAPDEQLYCGSHIGGVFHHSSFLGEGAVLAAGEIKTDSNGKIIELSSKSGHYRPKDSQNLYLLKYFQDRGADLSTVKFTFYDVNGKTEERNAQEYLESLEHLKGLAEMDLGLFA